MKRIRTVRMLQGFTLVEMMVGVTIFMVGVMGFTGMMLMQAHGNRVAKGSDEAATLLQSAIEDYANVLFENLGTDTSVPTSNGLTAGNIATEGPINKLGQPEGTGNGPYSYYRSVVVCDSSLSTLAAGANPQHCNGDILGSNRPPELACDNISPALTAREKLIRILVAWRDRNGTCHSKTSNSLAFDW